MAYCNCASKSHVFFTEHVNSLMLSLLLRPPAQFYRIACLGCSRGLHLSFPRGILLGWPANIFGLSVSFVQPWLVHPFVGEAFVSFFCCKMAQKKYVGCQGSQASLHVVRLQPVGQQLSVMFSSTALAPFMYCVLTGPICETRCQLDSV